MKQENEEIIASWRNFLDLPLELSVELGRTKLKIREILELAPDSVIKLSRPTGDGVDLRADDKSLLRGDIIVLEDRAGVRISEIIKEDN
jgi:flagellar motor switch protein FliN